MKLELSCISPMAVSAERILACNSASSRFGLTLTKTEAIALAEARKEALKETGRVEFRGGLIEDIIFAFCDSPYIEQAHYAETLEELTRLFYIFKSETLDQVTDSEIIKAMKDAFDGPPCYGAIELLEGKVLYELGHAERFKGLNQDDEQEDADEEESKDE